MFVICKRVVNGIAVFKRICGAQLGNFVVGAFVGVAAGVGCLWLEPEAFAQFVPVHSFVASRIVEHLCHCHWVALNEVVAHFSALFPLFRWGTVGGFVHEHLHEQSYSSTRACLATVATGVTVRKHHGSFAEVFLDICIAFFERAARNNQIVNCLNFGTDGNTAEGLHQTEIVESTEEFCLTVDFPDGFIGGVLGSCDFALVNVGNHLVGTVYTFVEGGPAFQNLAVVVAETEVYQLSKVG